MADLSLGSTRYQIPSQEEAKERRHSHSIGGLPESDNQSDLPSPPAPSISLVGKGPLTNIGQSPSPHPPQCWVRPEISAAKTGLFWFLLGSGHHAAGRLESCAETQPPPALEVSLPYSDTISLGLAPHGHSYPTAASQTRSRTALLTWIWEVSSCAPSARSKNLPAAGFSNLGQSPVSESPWRPQDTASKFETVPKNVGWLVALLPAAPCLGSPWTNSPGEAQVSAAHRGSRSLTLKAASSPCSKLQH